MVVFVLLVLSPAEDQMLRKVMDDLLPNETHVWTIWKETVLHAVRNISQDEKDGAFDFDLSIGDGLGANDQRLLRTLYQDAKTAYVAYQE